MKKENIANHPPVQLTSTVTEHHPPLIRISKKRASIFKQINTSALNPSPHSRTEARDTKTYSGHTRRHESPFPTL